MELPSRTAFSEHRGSEFRIHVAPDREEVLTLIEVKRLGPDGGGRPGAPEQFSVIFRGGAGDHLPQRTYPMDHETLGKFELFIVPIGPDDQGMRYQAVFG